MTGVLRLFEGMLFQVDRREDGKFFCEIYQGKVRDAVALTSDYDREEDAVELAKELILALRTKSEDT